MPRVPVSVSNIDVGNLTRYSRRTRRTRRVHHILRVLEALKGDRARQHSTRISDHFRVCFRWNAAGAEDVEIVDYH